MVLKKVVVISAICSLMAVNVNTARDKRQVASFPNDFEFGAATAAYQVEGAWDADGKGWSMWDHLVRTQPERIIDGSTGDIAANSYYLYKRDVQALKELGVKNYRFSISWPRIMPFGRPDYVNPLGVAYYNNLIDELLANGITPFATMYHWDLPQNLNEQGGWLTEDVVDWFGDYARVLYQNFGDRVKHWLTINEPYIHCLLGYGIALHAPLINSPGNGYYECARHILLAHSRSYHIYDDEFRATQGGQVGIVLSMDWGLPSSDSAEDNQAVADYIAFHLDHYMHPIFSEEGNYPQIVIDRVAAASANQGLNSSRLRPLSQEQINYMRGTSDFLALNHYSTQIIYRNESVNGMYAIPSVSDDLNIAYYKDPSWPNHGFVTEYAPGFYKLLIHLRDKYNPVIYVTENGCSASPDTSLNDDGRVQYFRNYLSALLDALSEGVNIKGYFAWSLVDSFEWAYGYTINFGLYDVDMNDPNRTRTAKKSALVYREIISSRTIDYSYDPDPHAVDERPDAGAAFTFTPSTLIVLVTAIITFVF